MSELTITIKPEKNGALRVEFAGNGRVYGTKKSLYPGESWRANLVPGIRVIHEKK